MFRLALPIRTRCVILVGSCIAVALPGTRAHGDDQLLIEALSEEIAKAPDADLLIRRGELFRHHRQWANAEADYLAAAKLDPSLTVIDYFRARARLEAGAPDEALVLAEAYVEHQPDEAEGWFLRGDILAAQGKPKAAAAEYAEGIKRAPRPRPEHYLRRAQLLATANVSPAKVLAALDEGIERLGPVISMVEYAISLEIQRENHAGALDRIALAMKHAPRRELWLVRQADVLVRAGRTEEAIASYRAALAAIDDLPPRYRETVPMEKLGRDARNALERLTSAPP